MKKQTLSVVISAYNEQEKIEACLTSVHTLADEIIFVDNTSTDKTIYIAKKYTTKIFARQNNPMLNVNKNFGFSKATGDWILSLDADERVTPELREEIISVIGNWKLEIGNSRVCGFWIPRKNIIFGKWIQSNMWWPDYQLRLFKKDKGRFPEQHVHEYVKVDGETAKLKAPLFHENYSSISQFLYKMDKIYTENEADTILKSGRRLGYIDALRFPVDDFLKTFFLQKGYKDGLHGLVLSMFQAFYAEVVFAKVWEKQGFQEENSQHFLEDLHREFKKIKSELQYWYLTSVISDTKNSAKKIFYRILRKSLKKKTS